VLAVQAPDVAQRLFSRRRQEQRVDAAIVWVGATLEQALAF
jgi:hypothetical protein